MPFGTSDLCPAAISADDFTRHHLAPSRYFYDGVPDCCPPPGTGLHTALWGLCPSPRSLHLSSPLCLQPVAHVDFLSLPISSPFFHLMSRDTCKTLGEPTCCLFYLRWCFRLHTPRPVFWVAFGLNKILLTKRLSVMEVGSF